MVYKIEKKNIFTLDKKEWYFAHCISLDCKMGAGIAVEMKNKFHLAGVEKVVKNFDIKVPNCVIYHRVFNLITKNKYYGKPTYTTLKGALFEMLRYILNNYNTIKKVAMPKIGCGLDGLSWSKVEEIIFDTFDKCDIEILVCHI